MLIFIAIGLQIRYNIAPSKRQPDLTKKPLQNRIYHSHFKFFYEFFGGKIDLYDIFNIF